jgi:hypothetical protein
MATPEQIQRRLQAGHINALETLRKLRKDRAEVELAAARNTESIRRAERLAASSARLQASMRLQHWNEHLSVQGHAERLRMASTMSQPIYEFDRLSALVRREEFAEFAAQRREAVAAEKVAAAVASAKVALTSYEKIVEYRK